MGRLGHLAIQFTHRMGAEVTVLSHSMNKKDEALAFGANHCYVTLIPPRSLSWLVNLILF